MTEDELRKRGYYLFGIDQDEFVQVRELKTDRVFVMGYGNQDALERSARLFRAEDEERALSLLRQGVYDEADTLIEQHDLDGPELYVKAGKYPEMERDA